MKKIILIGIVLFICLGAKALGITANTTIIINNILDINGFYYSFDNSTVNATVDNQIDDLSDAKNNATFLVTTISTSEPGYIGDSINLSTRTTNGQLVTDVNWNNASYCICSMVKYGKIVSGHLLGTVGNYLKLSTVANGDEYVLRLSHFDGGWIDNVLTNTEMAVNGTWQHMCITYDGVTAHSYINGSLKDTVAVSQPDTNATLSIGQTGLGSWTGYFDEFVYYMDNCSQEAIVYLNNSVFGDKESYPFGDALDNCSTYASKVLNVSLYNVTDGEIIEGNFEFNIGYNFGAGVQGTYASSISTSWQDFCTPNMDGELDVHIDYNAIGSSSPNTYIQNDIDITTSSITNIDLYWQEDTTQITISLVDEDDKSIEGAIITIYEWDIGTNEYWLTQQLESDNDGEMLANLVLNDVWYRFEVAYLGDIYLNTTNRKVTEDFTLQIILREPVDFEDLDIHNLNITLHKDKTTKMFNLTWGDITPTLNKILMEVVYANFTANETKLYDSNSTINDGVLGYHITEDTTSRSVTYVCNIYGNSSDGNLVYLASTSIDFRKEWDVFGEEALLMAFIFVGTMCLIGIYASATAGILLTIVSMIFMFALGFWEVGLVALTGLIVVLLVFFAKVRR